ncbi:DUF309 domain-containing protein [Paenibacillus sp. CMAA1364]
MKYEELYVSYLVYFNRDQDYFECHEVLEELWLRKDKDPLYKGLLQVAVGLYHFRNHNITGARKMMYRALSQLEQYPCVSLGIDLGVLVTQVRQYASQLDQFETIPFPYYDLTILILDPQLQQNVDMAHLHIQPIIPQRRGPKRPSKLSLNIE